MKNTVIKFGLYSLLVASILFAAALVFGDGMSYSTQEIFGYTTMALSLVFVFFGIRHYRNNVNDGKVSFGKALLLGLFISAFAGLGFGIVDYIYTTVINPDFVADYEATMIETMKAELSAAEFEVKSAELKQQMADYGSSGFMAALMFVTVVMMGFVVSLISALILQRK
ncbi:MAG: DUF4199 domain-containing protein [Flavobacteriaceae bacterium]|nr:DUF4199 domain-containing protein [Flavobacteriaceae bacterium]